MYDLYVYDLYVYDLYVYDLYVYGPISCSSGFCPSVTASGFLTENK